MDIHYLNDLFESFENKHILVVGDSMIDSYLKGKVDRISPEAPVPVLDVISNEKRLGGAGNVALNLQALGATSYLCSIIGDDSNADEFLSLMSQAQLSQEFITPIKGRKTSIKHRLISGTQQLMRVDDEDRDTISDEQQSIILSKLAALFEKQKIDALIIQDYNKGMLSNSFNQSLIDLSKKHKVFVAVDPKKENFLSFKSCNLFKPNLKELREGLGLKNKIAHADLDRATDKLRDQMNCEMVMITLSERGIYGNDSNSSFIVPAKVRDISDVSGAGDTVISVAVCCLTAGTDLQMATRLANLAGSLVCERVGVVPIDREQLLQEAILSLK